MTDRKKHGAAFWATVGLFLPVLYVLSFGPACWWTAEAFGPGRVTNFSDSVMVVYWPLGAVAVNEKSPFSKPLRWWITLGVPSGKIAFIPTGPDGTIRAAIENSP